MEPTKDKTKEKQSVKWLEDLAAERGIGLLEYMVETAARKCVNWWRACLERK